MKKSLLITTAVLIFAQSLLVFLSACVAISNATSSYAASTGFWEIVCFLISAGFGVLALVFGLKGNHARLVSSFLVLSTLMVFVSFFLDACIICALMNDMGYDNSVYVVTAVLFFLVQIPLIVASVLNYNTKSLAISIVYACTVGTLGLLVFIGMFSATSFWLVLEDLVMIATLVLTSLTLFLSRDRVAPAVRYYGPTAQKDVMIVRTEQSKPQITDPNQDVKDKLSAAQKLLEEGIITQEEYDAKRKKILGL